MLFLGLDGCGRRSSLWSAACNSSLVEFFLMLHNLSFGVLYRFKCRLEVVMLYVWLVVS